MRVLEQQTLIEPFGDPVAQVAMCGADLATLRSQELAASGIDAERLTVADYAFATATVLKAFAARASGQRPCRLALPRHAALESLVAVSSVQRLEDRLVYDIFIDAAPDDDLAALRANAEVVLVPLEPAVRWRALPRFGPGPHRIPIVCDGAFAMHFEHWVHLLWGAPLLVPNLLARAEGRRRRSPGGRAPSIIEKGADVHPSAYLEGAVIAEGAEVGAQCVIRNSYIGAQSRLSDFTKVAHSVLGPQTHTLADANFEYMVAGGGGTLTNLLLQDSLLGKQVFVTTGVIFWKDELGEQITVRHRGKEEPTGRTVLGGCAGHGSVLGARTIVAPGRALPNRTTVVMRKEEGVLRIDPRIAEGVAGCWYDGALVPTTEVDPEYEPEELVQTP